MTTRSRRSVYLEPSNQRSSTLHWSSSAVGDDTERDSATQSAFSAIEALDVDISDSDLNIAEMRLKHHIFRIQDGWFHRFEGVSMCDSGVECDAEVRL